MKATLYNQKGEKKGDLALEKSIFGIEPSEALVHQYLVLQQANARIAVAHTKSRGEVSGGGRKPFRQKGTGNARQGSRRNVHMRGGNVVFGPRNTRNFSKQMPKKMRRKALFSLLSAKAKDGKIMALDKFEEKAPKTKDFAALVSKLPVERNILVVGTPEEKGLQLASRNLENGKTILAGYLNPADLLKYEAVLFTEAALKSITETYTK